MQPLKKCKKKPLPNNVSGYSLESRVTENPLSEASVFIANMEIILSGYFLRRSIKKRAAIKELRPE
jgi:hypothetical protein